MLLGSLGLSSCIRLSLFTADRRHRDVHDAAEFLQPLRRNSLEWWYLNGHLQDSSGRDYAFHSALFRRYSFPYGYRWMLNTAFSDPAADTTYRDYEIFRNRECVRQIRTYESKEPQLIGNQRHQLYIDPQYLKANYNTEMFRGSITAIPQMPLLRQAPGGMMRYMDGMQAGYLSWPYMKLNGSFLLNGEAVTMKGEGWFDRQWNALPLTRKRYRWDWLSISSNGFRLMIFRTFDKRSGREEVQGTWLEADGRSIFLSNDSILLHADEYWTSPETGLSYPMQWQVVIPSRQLRACVDARIKQGEMTLRALGRNFMTYWEGPCNVWGVQGERVLEGRAFLEMTNAEKTFHGRTDSTH
jgi:predicted secreted hydrolase